MKNISPESLQNTFKSTLRELASELELEKWKFWHCADKTYASLQIETELLRLPRIWRFDLIAPDWSKYLREQLIDLRVAEEDRRQKNGDRKITRPDGQNGLTWGCSKCTWRSGLVVPMRPESLQAVVDSFQFDFLMHDCT